MIKKLLFLLVLSLASARTANAGVDPTSATWTLYKVYLYTSGDCSGTPVEVFNDANGQSFDFISNPTIATATAADSTYNCIAIKMGDNVTAVPSADEGTSCTAGQSYNVSICGSSFSYVDADSGSTVACTSGDDTPWVYFSTWSTALPDSQTANPFQPPGSNGDSTKGISLGSTGLTVSGNVTSTFVIDTQGTMATTPTGPQGADECSMAQPQFSFEN